MVFGSFGGVGIPSGGVLTDTHAASLTGSNTQAANAVSDKAVMSETALGGIDIGQDTNGSSYSYVAGTAEQLMEEVQSFTPSSAQNVVFVSAKCGHFTNSGTKVHTARARLDTSAGTLIASGSQSLGAGVSGWIIISGTILDVSAALHDIAFTTQQDVSDVNSKAQYRYAVNVVSGTLTGSDTHAASLTGAASCSACACS